MRNTKQNRKDLANVVVADLCEDDRDSLAARYLCAEWAEYREDVLWHTSVDEYAFALGYDDGESCKPSRSDHEKYLDGYGRGYRDAEEAADELHAERQAEEALYKED